MIVLTVVKTKLGLVETVSYFNSIERGWDTSEWRKLDCFGLFE